MHPWFPGRTEASNLRELDTLKAIGANTVRMDMPWADVEPTTKGVYDQAFLQRVDSYIDAAVARGIKPILNIQQTPCWASSAPPHIKNGCAGSEWRFYAPADPADLESISRFLASRYASRLAAFEVWNEPDLPGSLRGVTTKTASADLYAPMLKAAYRGVKASSPSLRVLGGAIEGTSLRRRHSRLLRRDLIPSIQRLAGPL